MSDQTRPRYLVFMEGSPAAVVTHGMPMVIGAGSWVPDQDMTLGGVFYDFLIGPNGAVGVRYWAFVESVSHCSQPPWDRFLKDERVAFNVGAGYVDLWAQPKLQARHPIYCDGSQEFGGDFVLTNSGKVAIAFEIPDEVVLNPVISEKTE